MEITIKICAAKTGKGKPCARTTSDGSEYCWQHKDDENVVAPVSYKVSESVSYKVSTPLPVKVSVPLPSKVSEPITTVKICETDEVWYYSPKVEPYGVFSNLYPLKEYIVDLESNTTYFCSSVYFQSMKFKGSSSLLESASRRYADVIGIQDSGMKATMLARQSMPRINDPWVEPIKSLITSSIKEGVTMRKDWDEIKDNVMRRAVFKKFHGKKKFEEALLSTSSKKIFEHAHGDPYWSDNHPMNDPTIHGDGKNMMGVILEETRHILLNGSLKSNKDRCVIIPKKLTVSTCKFNDSYTHVFMVTDDKVIFIIGKSYAFTRQIKTENDIILFFKYVLSLIAQSNTKIGMSCENDSRLSLFTSVIIGMLYSLCLEKSLQICSFLGLNTSKTSSEKELSIITRNILNSGHNYREFD